MERIQGQGDKVVIWGEETLSNEFIAVKRINSYILTFTPLLEPGNLLYSTIFFSRHSGEMAVYSYLKFSSPCCLFFPI